jgi:hypothetical protein
MDQADMPWRKSTRSGPNGCVEVAFLNERVAVRDSKDQQGPRLEFTSFEWQAFISGVYNGEFDLP